jgi:hypothetical protein
MNEVDALLICAYCCGIGTYWCAQRAYKWARFEFFCGLCENGWIRVGTHEMWEHSPCMFCRTGKKRLKEYLRTKVPAAAP